MDRRGFLQVSVTGAGGLLLGFKLGCKGDDPASTLTTTSPTGAAPTGEPVDLNAWIRIDPDDTVTFKISEAEMGQGVMTALSMILAEDLDADWARVKAEHAPAAAQQYGPQMTGGSTSVRQGWERLRLVGAQARAMLLGAAAARLGVPVGELATAASTISHVKTGRTLGYGEVAKDAAAITPPEKPALKPSERYLLVGRRQQRLDQPAKITGSAVYGLDVRLPGMLVAQVVRPPMLGGDVAKVDDTKARAVPGVKHVVRIPTGVAVVADNFWAAKLGREALAVTWKDGPNKGLSSASVSSQLAKAAPRGVQARKDGDAARALRGAKTVLRAAYEVPYLAHAPMEPLNATAQITKDGCTIWAGTQSQMFVQKAASDILKIPMEKVTVHTTFLGGGFGRRAQIDYVKEAIHVAREVAAPVKVVWTREDDMRGGNYRPAALSQLEAGLDADGWPIAWVQRIAAPSILEQLGPLAGGIDDTAVEGVKNLPYKIPNVLVTYANAKLPVTTWFWRSVGSSQNAFAVECFLDELARAGGKDPLEVRRRLLADQPRHLAVLEAAAKAAHWGEPLLAGRARGVAVHESFGSFVAQVAEVSIADKVPRVHKVWCAIDCGRTVNPDTIEAQMESGIVYGLSAALHGAIRLDGGMVATSNFHDYPVVRMKEAPVIETTIISSQEKPGGVGEPGTPPIAPAVCNAILALTGVPVRNLPIKLA